MITKNKWENLKKLMSSLDIYEENIDENFIKG